MREDVKWYYLRPVSSQVLDQISIDNSSVNIYIDLLSVITGIYTKVTLEYEVDLIINKDVSFPTTLYKEFYTFGSYIGNYFRQKSIKPRFIVFYDYGICKQNKFFGDYKLNRKEKELTDEDKLRLLIKRHYISNFEKIMSNVTNLLIINMKEYESDCLPHLLMSSSNNLGHNIIISNDKDLCQSLVFDNVHIIQTRKMAVVTKSNIKDIFKTKYDLLPEYVALLQAFTGDKTDNIPPVRERVGIKTAEKLIRQLQLPSDPNEFTPNQRYILEEKYNIPIDILKRNYELTSFDRQIERIDPNTKDQIIQRFIHFANK